MTQPRIERLRDWMAEATSHTGQSVNGLGS